MVFAVAVALVLGAIIFTLFVRAQDLPEAPPVSPTAHLEDRKAQIYENLRDLNFEFRVGKLSDADYQKTKVDLQRELAKVMADIDGVNATAPKPIAVAAVAPAKAARPESMVCPHCGAKFPQALKFCGECGKAMAS